MAKSECFSPHIGNLGHHEISKKLIPASQENLPCDTKQAARCPPNGVAARTKNNVDPANHHKRTEPSTKMHMTSPCILTRSQ